ncbi:hypothetical protein BIFDEN_01782 [Bifidobacterium dentium ATCC 27678]|nr:hypothetical protein BIFDEN_01782 [Bifidobacterium dentium ATCC 27678]
MRHLQAPENNPGTPPTATPNVCRSPEQWRTWHTPGIFTAGCRP